MQIHTIDLLFQGTPHLIAAHVIESEGVHALVETGPASCHAALIDGLAALGLAPGDIREVFITHIHLDHAGGAGWWAQQGARVHVHENGARHLIDPAKLIDSATRIYGDRMDSLWGTMLPAPADRVHVLHDGDRVQMGAVEIIAWDTPGHARHHLAFVVNDVCFTGDVAGVRLPGTDYLSVAAAPPQFEPLPYVESIDRLLAAEFRLLYLAHFGPVQDVASHLQRYRARVLEVHDRVSALLLSGASSEAIADAYAQHERSLCPASHWAGYELANGTGMSAAGVERYVATAAVRP
jgi:glyoxylase-like metal-dependent hydrolase (beta-lactamase superfamily II)